MSLAMKHKSNDSGLDPKAHSNPHLGYIESRWEIVAAVAWKEYLAHRNKALLFTASTDPGGEMDCIYLPLDLLEGHPLMKEYSNLVRCYDPTKQIVALFLTPPGRVSAYRGWLIQSGLRLQKRTRELGTCSTRTKPVAEALRRDDRAGLPQLLAAHVGLHRRYLADRLEFIVWQIDRLFDERLGARS
jgi:hypothetical protein